ncbi:speckle-type POZ protein-like [Haematobia irritans]|uniref:speckle-type POZ protein-like n=1 Tax=Haematobia irritans TaxID=7368 RepID=UPI003F50626E
MPSANTTKICALHKPTDITKIPSGDQWFCDRVRVSNFCYLWKIKNFSQFKDKVESPVFAERIDSKITWQLIMSENEGGRIVLLLKLISSDQSRVKFKLKCGLLRNDGEFDYALGKWNGLATSYGAFIFPRNVTSSDLQDKSRHLLSNDVLTMYCDMTVMIDIFDSSPCDVSGMATIEARLLCGLSSLFRMGKFSDVTVRVQGKSYPAHKAILSLRSDVFAAMLDHDSMLENTSNQIVIEDFDYRVIQEMLRFIYTNKAPNIDEMASDLLAAADKYDLTYLKVMCESVLYRDITIDNALATFVLADRYTAKTLRARTKHFIKVNLDTIKETDEWNIMLSNYKAMVKEIEAYNGCE